MTAQPAATDERPPPADRAAPGRVWRDFACAGTAAAGLLHLLAAVQHIASGALVVGFFLVTAAAQFGGAVWLATTGRAGRRPAPILLTLAVAVTTVLLLLYLAAHSSTLLAGLGLAHGGHDAGGAHIGAADAQAVAPSPDPPGGELPAAPEEATPLGSATVAAQLLALIGLLALLPERWRSRAGDALAVVGLTVWLLWFTGALT